MAEAGGPGRPRAPPATVRDAGPSGRAATWCRRRWWKRRRPTRAIVTRGAVRPGPARPRLPRPRGGGGRGQRHLLRAVRVDLERRRALAASVARRLEAGTVFVNAHGMSAMDPAPHGRLEAVGLRGGARGPRGCGRSPAPGWSSPGREPVSGAGERAHGGGPALSEVGRAMLDLRSAAARWSTAPAAPSRRADVGVQRRPGGGHRQRRRAGPAGDRRRRPAWWRPGFVDLHTHYDAQLFWDPTRQPVAAARGDHGDRGELRVLPGPGGPGPRRLPDGHAGPGGGDAAGRPRGRPRLDWASFGEWLDRLEGRIGVNAGFLVGHSTLRRVAMGDDAVGKAASPEQVAAMVEELAPGPERGRARLLHLPGPHPPRRRRAAGAVAGGRPAASSRPWRPPCADHPGTTLELIVPGASTGSATRRSTSWPPSRCWPTGRSTGTCSASRRPTPTRTAHQLAASDAAAARGATVVALTLPHTMRIRLSFENGAILDGLPGLAGGAGPPQARAAGGAWPTPRCAGAWTTGAAVRRGRHPAAPGRVAAAGHRGDLRRRPTPAYEGRTVGDVAAERGQSPFDALLDVVVADELRTGLRPPIPESEEDWVARAEAWLDPRAVVGGSDAGAHLDTMCGAVYSTSLLGDGVRRAVAAQLGGGGPPAHRRARPPLRPAPPGPPGRGLVGRRGGVRPRADRPRPRAHPRRPARPGPAVSTPRPPASSTCW